MKKVTYEDAIKLLLELEDESSYRDYVYGKDNILLGSEVGKSTILENLLDHENDLQISEECYWNINLGNCLGKELNISLGIRYTKYYDDNTNSSVFIPTDYNKLIKYIESIK